MERSGLTMRHAHARVPGVRRLGIPTAQRRCRFAGAPREAGRSPRFFTRRDRPWTLKYPTSAATDAAVSTRPGAHERSGDFAWERNWWPVQVVSNLDPARPNRIQLLGRWFVAWRGLSGQWSVMEDMCPHRLAPLSEGRVESDGTLMCAYHAWRFDEGGNCVRIPHADDDAGHCTACASPRSKVTKYPSKVFGDLLWLWPDASPGAEEASSIAAIPMPAYLAEKVEALKSTGEVAYTRTLPYAYDLLVENLCDPAHVPVSHHGLAPVLSRYKAQPLHMVPEDPLDTSDADSVVGSVRYASIVTEGAHGHTEFMKPCLGIYADSGMRMYMYCVPVSPSASRLFVLDGAKEGSSIPRLPIPWLFHSIQNAAADGDAVLLAMQQQHLDGPSGHKAGKRTAAQYYLPTTSDNLVAAFRKWYESEGKGGPSYPGNGGTAVIDWPRERLLDRYNQHTKDCATCSAAMKMFERIVFVCKVLIPALFLGMCGWIGTVEGGKLISEPSTVLVFAAGMGLCAIVQKFAEQQRQSFIFVDWVHAEHN